MKRPAWLTDIHRNFAEGQDLDFLCRDIADEEVDVVLICGDIDEAPAVRQGQAQAGMPSQPPSHDSHYS